MNANAEFLNYVYQNSQMGVDTLQQLLDITEDEKLQAYLEKQLEGYRKFHSEARDLLNRNGYDEKGLGTFEKVRTYLMVNLQTMTDASTSHIAKMLIQGSTMGVTSLTRQIRDYDGEDTEVLDFAKKQLKREEKNIDELKKFL